MKTPDIKNLEVEISVQPDPEAKEPVPPAELIFADAEDFIDRMQAIDDGVPPKRIFPH